MAPKTLRVSYQGAPGAFSEEASLQFFTARNHEVEFHPCPSFDDAFAALANDAVDRAVIPIQNSLAGPIYAIYDLLLRHSNITIVGELDLRIRHCLIAAPGVPLKEIRVVRSHHMALAQCKEYLQRNQLVSEVGFDTGGCAKALSKDPTSKDAVIASRRAALLYDLNIVEQGIEDHKANYTRFLILSKKKFEYVPEVPCKTSLVFSLENGPGALWKALSAFAITNIDLTNIACRQLHTLREVATFEQFEDSSVEKRWGYVFYIDICGHADAPFVEKALAHFQQITPFYRVLGAYPRHE
ncbi:Prephenate dehydratase [Gracilaria domingensis]|nr:Prephenate dehydratase [Gracilaria domingensis]